MNVQWFYTEYKCCDDEEINVFIAVTDHFYVEFIEKSYAGFIPYVFVEEQFNYHPFLNRPGNIGCKNRAEALKRFKDFDPISDVTMNVPRSYRMFLKVFEKLFHGDYGD